MRASMGSEGALRSLSMARSVRSASSCSGEGPQAASAMKTGSARRAMERSFIHMKGILIGVARRRPQLNALAQIGADQREEHADQA